MSFSSGFAAGAGVRQSRDTLRMQAEQRQQELTKMGYSFDDNGGMSVREDSAAQAEQLQAKETAQLAKSLQAKLSAQATDNAFEDYSHTGDASYLQNALTNDPLLKQAWSQRGVQLVTNIDYNNDSKLLSNAGLTDTHYDTPEKQSIISKNAYKIYDGKDWSIGLANKAVAETGALTRMGQRRAEPLLKNYEEFRGLMAGPKVSPYTAEGHKYENEIASAADKYDLPPNLLASMMSKESRGDPNAVSSKGARGLMQLMPATAEEQGVKDIHNPAQNIEGGASYLRKMLDKYKGDLPKALAAYNAGPGNVDKYGGIPPYGETQDYVNTVMDNFNKGESHYGRTADSSGQALAAKYNMQQPTNNIPGGPDQTINTILEHRRGISNAAKGTTNENIDQAITNETAGVAQKNIALQQENIKIGQEDKKIGIAEEANRIKAATDGSTTEMKNLKAADGVTKDLLDQYGGEDKFFNTDFSNPKEFNKAYKSIIKIENLEGTKLTETDRKNITDVRQLISLGDPAAKLTDSDTGLLDNAMGNMEKYFTDNVKGTEGKAAYAAFRNSVRHALYGSALTPNEIDAFNQAYGQLGNKLGPVLEQFQTSLNQVKAKIDSTSNLMNPYSAKVRLGADTKKLESVQNALQARIDYIKGLQNPSQTKPADRKPLDQIFGGK